MAETPDWLKPNTDDDDLANASSGGLTDIEDGSPTSQGSSFRKNNNEDIDKDKESKRCLDGFKCSFGAVFILLISCAFLALFIYSAATQDNDKDKIQWLLFYALSAANVGLFMIHYMCCFPNKLIYLLSVGMAIWSIVYIVIAALQFKDTPKGGAKVGTGDNDNQTLRQELGYELGGASLSLLSSLYHMMIMMCCINKNKKEE